MKAKAGDIVYLNVNILDIPANTEGKVVSTVRKDIPDGNPYLVSFDSIEDENTKELWLSKHEFRKEK